MGNPTLKASNAFLYQNIANNSRTLIAVAADGTGVQSLTNNVLYWDGSGDPQSIFTPSAGASNPRMAYSRDYAFFEDGVAADLYKWNINTSLTKAGIAAPTEPVLVSPNTLGGSLSVALTSVNNASGGNTVYNATSGLDAIISGTTVTIFGFTAANNNGVFTVVSSTSTTLTVNNPSGTSATEDATVTTLNAYYPSTDTNGWSANQHVGSYEGGVAQGYSFGLGGSVSAYTNPGNVADGDDSTYAYASGQHTHTYYGCVWKFSTAGSPPANAVLNILSEVPLDGTDGQSVNQRSAGIWYSLDAGSSWTQIYDVPQRNKQWDIIPLPDGQDFGNIRVMAFLDAHDDMYQKIYSINIQASIPGSGQITLQVGRNYYLVYGNSVDSSYSDVSPISASTGPLTGGQVELTNFQASPDSQVDTYILLATADGGDPTTLYEVGTFPSTTTQFIDSLDESALLNKNIWQESDTYGNEIGVYNNTPPPNGFFPTLHKGRLWLALGQYVYFSKGLSDVLTSTGIVAGRYEECWPASNALDIAPGSEIVRGMLSDGNTLYIGTERHIRRVLGDDPTNFSPPNVIFSETGLLNQSTWNIVFREGTPVGCIWMTPDFRIIFSDFNTYEDVGTPIQALLNTVNPDAATKSFGTFVGYGPYNFYVIMCPTGSNTNCDTAFVFDLHTNRWYVWKFADKMLTDIFYFNLGGIPRWLLFSDDGTCRYVDPTLVVDKQSEDDATDITVTLQTSWLHFGDPSMRKLLNSIEVLSSDPDITVTLEAAQTQADFDNPTVLLDDVPFTTDIFGQMKAMCVTSNTLARFFRITFSSTSDAVTSKVTDNILDYFSIVFYPLNRV